MSKPRWLLDDDGATLRHNEYPRFVAVHRQQADGSWSAFGDDIEFLDDPPRDATVLARLMREAGDAFHELKWGTPDG